MADTTPNSLIKIDTPVTARYGKKQISIFLVSGFIVVNLFDLICKHPHNTPLVVICIILIFLIIGIVYACARSGTQLYNTEVKAAFKVKNVVKKNEIYKFNPKNSIEKKAAWTGLEGVDEKGRLKFKQMKIYENNYCNRGICWIVTPSDSNDPDSYYAGIKLLYQSIPQFCLHKTITAQSKHLVNISEVYEKKLQNKNLPHVVRSGYMAKKKFFEEVKNRVGWMHVIFLGINYIPNDEEANHEMDDLRERYGDSLSIHGITVRAVTDPTEYAVICAQMCRMENIGGLV